MDEYYGKPLAEDEAEKTIETNKALARWIDRMRFRYGLPASHNTSTTPETESSDDR